MNQFYQFPVYYGGFDPGSGTAGLKVVGADNARNETLVIDSQIADGNSEKLLARGDINAQVKDVIRPGESLISFNGVDYYLEDLIREGRNARSELANPARYWSDYARVLLLCLASQLIPERCFTLRLVTALPVTLYNKENRQLMKQALSGHFRYSYNGRQRECTIFTGYVAMEGQGVLIHAGQQQGEQAVIDIGERTTDFVGADGQKLLTSLCYGNQELGVGMITDAVSNLYKRYGRVLSTPKLHEVMRRYVYNEHIEDVTTSTGTLAGDDVVRTIDKARAQLAKGIVSFASSIWNVEGEAVGERFEQITIGGGGAYYVADLLDQHLPRTYVPNQSEKSNLFGYCDLALQLESKVAGIWVA